MTDVVQQAIYRMGVEGVEKLNAAGAAIDNTEAHPGDTDVGRRHGPTPRPA